MKLKHLSIILLISLFGCNYNQTEINSIEKENKLIKDSLEYLKSELSIYRHVSQTCVYEPFIIPVNVRTIVGQQSKFRLLLPDWTLLRNGNELALEIKFETQLESDYNFEKENCGTFLYYRPNEQGTEVIKVLAFHKLGNDSISLLGEASYTFNVEK